MRSKRRIIRKKRTLKFRGGDLDNPDTKDFMNSKIEALEQKIAELEAEMPVQIGYKKLPTIFPLFVNRNISVEDFWKYVGKGVPNNPTYNITDIFYPAIYSLPNVRGLNIEECFYSFTCYSNNEDAGYVRDRNVDALNAKYPGLFAPTVPTNTSYAY